MNPQKEILLSFEKEKLTDIIIELLSKLNEFEKNEFISKNIDTQLALDNIGEDDGVDYLKDVSKFCKDCLKGEYYVECDYDGHWDNYEDNNYEDSEWAEIFTEYFNIALMYSRNKDYDVAFEAFELLLNCLHEAESNVELLGTEEPDSSIDIDWFDIFNQYYLCMKNCVTDKVKMTEIAFDVWLNHGNACTDAIVNNIEEVDLIEKIIRKKIEEIDENWSLQHLYFELLKRFYERYNSEFSGVELAKSFLKYNVNFYNDITKEYFELGQWKETVEVIMEALKEVQTPKIKFELKIRLVDCYENLNEFEEAFNRIYALFKANTSYELYKRTRYFAEKINKLDTFRNDAISFLEVQTAYDSNTIFMQVLSYEGLVDKLINFIKSYEGYSRHEYLKYASKALIYRAFNGEKVNLPNLTEYIDSVDNNKMQGIVDLEVLKEDVMNRDYYLNSAVEMLKEMVKFHIDAVSRSRYERAACYCSIVKDILGFLNKGDEFLKYYTNLLNQNSRRPALKDEMKKKIKY